MRSPATCSVRYSLWQYQYRYVLRCMVCQTDACSRFFFSFTLSPPKWQALIIVSWAPGDQPVVDYNVDYTALNMATTNIFNTSHANSHRSQCRVPVVEWTALLQILRLYCWMHLSKSMPLVIFFFIFIYLVVYQTCHFLSFTVHIRCYTNDIEVFSYHSPIDICKTIILGEIFISITGT